MKIVIRDQEYDAFGPWLVKIESEDLLPKQFKKHVDMTIEYDQLIKVPVKMDRLDLKPGMVMYDKVIALYDNRLCLYEKKEHRIHSSVIHLTEVSSIYIYKSLLYGQLSIFLEHDTIEIDYNTVSDNIIDDLVTSIRDKITNNFMIYNIDYLSEDNIKALDHYYHTDYKSLKQMNNTLNILSLQETRKLSYSNLNLGGKLMNHFKRSHINSCLYMTNGKELILSKKGEDFKRKGKKDHSLSYTYIPFHRINNIDLLDDPVTEEIKYIRLSTGQHKYRFAFHNDNERLMPFHNNLKKIHSML